MQTKKLFTTLMILVFVLLSNNTQSLYAQDEENDLALFSATFTSGGAYGINMFYTEDDFSWYTSITAVLPADNLSGADYSMDEVIGQHIGVFLNDFVGIGFVWGGSYYQDEVTNGISEEIAFVRAGFEIPLLFRPIKEIPIMVLPFFEAMVDTDEKEDWGNQRYGVNAIAHFQFLNPLVFQIEAGIYNSSIREFQYKVIESGFGYNVRVGVGFNIN
jgi:hypothetical protein